MLSLVLKSKNSNGWHNLFVDPTDSGGATLTVVGHDNKLGDYQLDFDELDAEELQQFVRFLQAGGRLPAPPGPI